MVKILNYSGFPKNYRGKRYILDSGYTTKQEARGKEAKLRRDDYRTWLRPVMVQGVRIYEVYKRSD